MHVLPIPLARRSQRSRDLAPLDAPGETPPVHASASDFVQKRDHARRIEGVGLGSVAATAAVLFGALFTAVSMGIVALWIAASASGTVGEFEDFMQSIGFRDFAVSGNRIVLGLIFIAAALTLLGTALAVVAAGLYNALAATGHGLRVRITPEHCVRCDESAAIYDGNPPHAA